MSTKIYEVQSAIYERLQNISCPVYDYVPDGSQSPYVTFGIISSTSQDTMTDEVITVTLEGWSEAKGKKQIVSIMNEIEQALEPILSVLGAIVVIQRIADREIIPHQDLYQGNITIEFQIDWS